jgi:hypothetical protein
MEDFLNIICNYFVHSLILFTFLTLFFIFFISKLVKNGFVVEITHLIDLAMKSLNNIKLPFNLPNNLNINNIINVFSKPDETTTMYNNLLIHSLLIVNIILWTGLIIILAILKYYNWEELELGTIALENFLIFSFVGIVEYLFFTQIAFKFVPVEPSFIKSQITKILQSQ